MKKEFDIVHEPIITSDILDEKGEVIQKGILKDKWNIYYYEDDIQIDKQFHSYDGITPQCEIKPGYTQKTT